MYTLIAILLINSALSDIKTEFQWLEVDGKQACFERDSETNGSLYSNKVAPEKCKPANTIYLFNYDSGDCFEADEQTAGKSFFEKVRTSQCRPKIVDYILGEIKSTSGCFEIDKKSAGRKYYKKVQDKLCHKTVKEYFWKPKGELEGICIVKGINNKLIEVKDSLCKPDKVKFYFKRTQPYKGECYEQHPENMKYYSVKTKVVDCKPLKTYYAFRKKDKSLQGECYEVDNETNGDLYIDKVSTELCK